MKLVIYLPHALTSAEVEERTGIPTDARRSWEEVANYRSAQRTC